MMKMKISFVVVLGLVVNILPGSIKAQGDDPNYVLRWASSGGGWRAMFADTGWANAFSQAGLIDIANASSKFSAVSTESGGSWFSTQFFYSPLYFQLGLGTPDVLYNFTIDWMTSYLNLQLNLTQNPDCDFLEDIINITATEELAGYCNLFVDYNGNWADFVQAMLLEASTDYGDPNLVSRPVSFDNRVPPLSNTDLYVQTTIVPASRIRATRNRASDLVVYFGPGNQVTPEVYTLPMATQLAIKDNEWAYFSTAPEGSFPLQVYVSTTSETFTFAEWTDFFLYPATGATVLIDQPTNTSTGQLQEPFGGLVPNVAQIASASSAAIGDFSGLVPITLAHLMSPTRYDIVTSNATEEDKLLEQAALESTINSIIYSEELFDNIAVCDQWPNPCGNESARFIDGTYGDGPTLALNVGQYQTKEGGNLSKTFKAIVTFNNEYWNSNWPVLSYFNTTFNEGIEPGDFIWPDSTLPNNSASGSPVALPYRSTQIFDTYLDEELLANITEPIEGTNLSTAVLKTTTIENPAFKTVAGQSVDFLLLRINSNIPTEIIGVPVTEEYTVPLAEMARTIASSEELVSRIEAFVADGEMTPAPTTAAPAIPSGPPVTLPPGTPPPVTAAPTTGSPVTFEPTRANETKAPSPPSDMPSDVPSNVPTGGSSIVPTIPATANPTTTPPTTTGTSAATATHVIYSCAMMLFGVVLGFLV